MKSLVSSFGIMNSGWWLLHINFHDRNHYHNNEAPASYEFFLHILDSGNLIQIIYVGFVHLTPCKTLDMILLMLSFVILVLELYYPCHLAPYVYILLMGYILCEWVSWFHGLVKPISFMCLRIQLWALLYVWHTISLEFLDLANTFDNIITNPPLETRIEDVFVF